MEWVCVCVMVCLLYYNCIQVNSLHARMEALQDERTRCMLRLAEVGHMPYPIVVSGEEIGFKTEFDASFRKEFLEVCRHVHALHEEYGCKVPPSQNSRQSSTCFTGTN